jgi:8-oxo-dGTP pyrophosphatase MutT (NUDIX family)
MGKKTKTWEPPVSAAAQQVAALPYRLRNAELEILVITSRKRKRIIIPKGWPMPGKADSIAASIEAKEEAGVSGRVRSVSVGTFDYLKRKNGGELLITASVFPLEVAKIKDKYKERKQRKRRWLSVPQALTALDDHGLRTLLADCVSRNELPHSQAMGSRTNAVLEHRKPQ